MKTSSFFLFRFCFTLILFLLVIGSGCQTGMQVSNPFAKKPQPTDPKTPAAIDNIKLTAPPEKYTKSGSEKENNGNSLAQKGKYEQYPGGKKAEAPKVAMNNSGRTETYAGGSPSPAQGSVPGFISNQPSAAPTGTPNSYSTQNINSGSGFNAPAAGYSAPSAGYTNQPMPQAAGSSPIGSWSSVNNATQNISPPASSSVSQTNAWPVPAQGYSAGSYNTGSAAPTGTYGSVSPNGSYSAGPQNGSAPSTNGYTGSVGNTFAPGSIGGY